MQKKSMEIIRKRIILMNIIAIIISAGLSCVSIFNRKKGLLCDLVLIIIVGLALAVSVIHMRKTIKATGIAFPNESLVFVHLFNFIGWVALYAVDIYLRIKYN